MAYAKKPASGTPRKKKSVMQFTAVKPLYGNPTGAYSWYADSTVARNYARGTQKKQAKPRRRPAN